MVKAIAINCYHFIKRKVNGHLDTKIEASSRTEPAPIRLIKLKNDAERTSDSSLQKKNGHRIQMSLIPWIIPPGITPHVMWNITKPK